MQPSDIFAQVRAARLGKITRIPICSSHAEPHKFTQNLISHNKQFQTSIKHMVMQSNHSKTHFTRKLSGELTSLTLIDHQLASMASHIEAPRITT